MSRARWWRLCCTFRSDLSLLKFLLHKLLHIFFTLYHVLSISEHLLRYLRLALVLLFIILWSGVWLLVFVSLPKDTLIINFWIHLLILCALRVCQVIRLIWSSLKWVNIIINSTVGSVVFVLFGLIKLIIIQYIYSSSEFSIVVVCKEINNIVNLLPFFKFKFKVFL